MSRLRSQALVALTVLVLCAGSCAATTLNPLADCKAHGGKLSQHYTARQLETALKRIPASVKEYTTCFTTISNQLNAQLGNGHVGDAGSVNSGGGSGTVILIVVIVVVLLLGGGGAFWAYRRNRPTGGAPS